MTQKINPFIYLSNELKKYKVNFSHNGTQLIFSKGDSCIYLYLSTENSPSLHDSKKTILPEDLLMREPEKIISLVLSKLKLNRVVFARNCELKKLPKPVAEKFLNTYHLMNATKSGSNYGLIFQNEIIGIASFSNGRKMRRLPENKRSFELIRFCCKSGFTVTGGLSKLLKHFVIEKKAGDVMTYVDKQLSNGESFAKAGFKRTEEMPPLYFLVNRINFSRQLIKDPTEIFDEKKFYLSQNAGNIKMVYTPE